MSRFFLLAVLSFLLFSLPLRAAEVGEPAPKLIIKELDGKEFDLTGLKGKVVLVNFWATWCEPCQKEMPVFDSIYRKFHPQGLEMIGVSVNSSHELDEVTKVMSKFSYPATILKEAEENGFSTERVMPTTYIIDTKASSAANFPLTATRHQKRRL